MKTNLEIQMHVLVHSRAFLCLTVWRKVEVIFTALNKKETPNQHNTNCLHHLIAERYPELLITKLPPVQT